MDPSKQVNLTFDNGESLQIWTKKEEFPFFCQAVPGGMNEGKAALIYKAEKELTFEPGVVKTYVTPFYMGFDKSTQVDFMPYITHKGDLILSLRKWASGNPDGKRFQYTFYNASEVHLKCRKDQALFMMAFRKEKSNEAIFVVPYTMEKVD